MSDGVLGTIGDKPAGIVAPMATHNIRPRTIGDTATTTLDRVDNPSTPSLPTVDDRPLVVEEVAWHLRLTVKSVRRLIASGRLPAVRIGRRLLIQPSALAAAVQPVAKAVPA